MSAHRFLILAKWILKDNAAMNNALEKMTFSPHKRYRVCELQV